MTNPLTRHLKGLGDDARWYHWILIMMHPSYWRVVGQTWEIDPDEPFYTHPVVAHVMQLARDIEDQTFQPCDDGSRAARLAGFSAGLLAVVLLVLLAEPLTEAVWASQHGGNPG
jgi:hypothetical protein